MLLGVPAPTVSPSSHLPNPYYTLAMNQGLGVQPGLGQLGLVGGQYIAGRDADKCLVEKPEHCGNPRQNTYGGHGKRHLSRGLRNR